MHPSDKCPSCMVVSKRKLFSVKEIRVAYDNNDNYAYLKIHPLIGVELKAVERVIFTYSKNGLDIFAYIPETRDANLSWKGILNFDPNLYQKLTNIELYMVKSQISSQDIMQNNIKIGNKQVMQEIRTAAELKAPAVATYKKTYSYRQSKASLRDIYRQEKTLRFYLEAGIGVSFSYRNIQVVSPQPDRTAYEARYKNDKVGFSWSGSLRFGYTFTSNGSAYLGLMTSNQQYRSGGGIDWNTGRLYTNSVSPVNYDFHFRGVEFGYSYSQFSAKRGLSTDLGLHFLRTKTQISASKFTWGPNIAIGPKIRTGIYSDLRVMPNFYLNISRLESLRSNDLATRLFTAGIKFAWRVYI
ncbi:hypothetical protein FEN17_17985 [Dyadobacter luticola]|uniref:Uncharacterized protein n=2 Tax=Dyadobacter luticola TaxID=1979387 RepID=A0A5R9KYE0_9BACT|nr:hypothetical protein FEN17_17985 [Dyadobacter luticola]